MVMILFQERIGNLSIVSPLTNMSYPKGENISLKSAVDKGSDINYTWNTDGETYNLEYPKVVYNNTGKATSGFRLFIYLYCYRCRCWG